jgi:hypothetical protein
LFIHGHESHLSTCVDTQSPKYLEMAQGHISLSVPLGLIYSTVGITCGYDNNECLDNSELIESIFL